MKLRISRYLLVFSLIVLAFVTMGMQRFELKKTADIQSAKDQIEYYRLLTQQCRRSAGVACCMSSLNRMRVGDFKVMPEAGCPNGKKRNALKCPDSYSWCEPSQK